MNKLLQKLADQCRTEYRDGHGGYTEQFDEEKFAELIVKETMQVVANNLPQNTYLDVADAVIEHFGVKE